LCVLGAVLLNEAADARTLGASAFAQPPAGVDCPPRWSLDQPPGINRIADHDLLNALAVVNRNEIWAVGHEMIGDSLNKPLTARWNGVRWNTISAPKGYGNYNNLAGIAALGPNDIWAA